MFEMKPMRSRRGDGCQYLEGVESETFIPAPHAAEIRNTATTMRNTSTGRENTPRNSWHGYC